MPERPQSFASSIDEVPAAVAADQEAWMAAGLSMAKLKGSRMRKAMMVSTAYLEQQGRAGMG